MNDPLWQPVATDGVLSSPPSVGTAGRVARGDDLRLDIGWDRFEQLMLSVTQGALGLHQVKFRRYGAEGQAQHGIDLAGRHPDGTYTVVQCKDYAKFRPTDLRNAVAKFARGKRPFNAQRLIICISNRKRDTKLDDELAAAQDTYKDLDIKLWYAEQINEILRGRADIVSRFWTHETATDFCTSVPLPGVPAPMPNWARVADQVLLSPLGVDGLSDRLRRADTLCAHNPSAAADVYGELATTLATDGFDGHAHVLRHKQLDALVEGADHITAAALAAGMAAKALHEANFTQADQLKSRLNRLAAQRESDREHAAEVRQSTADSIIKMHADLIDAAVQAMNHPLGDTTALRDRLFAAPTDLATPDYQPLLVLLMAELTMVMATVAPWTSSLTDTGEPPATRMTKVSARLSELDPLITGALAKLTEEAQPTSAGETALRLRLIRAQFDEPERMQLLSQARRLRIPRSHAALVVASQARREALEGSSDEAHEHWRQAVGYAIHDGCTDDARGWLYAIRALNARYGPWTDKLDEEHLLAQGLPTGSGRLIRRVRDMENDTRLNSMSGRDSDAIRAARRWLADSIVLGHWVDETQAADLLGDLYAKNAEPDLAASCYQWAGRTKKLVELAKTTGDHLLPPSAIGDGPWWTQETNLAGIAAQRDLLDDNIAAELLVSLFDLVRRTRSGEVTDNPGEALKQQATKTMCLLAARGSEADATAVLDLLATDVQRPENRFLHHDEEHVQACLRIMTHHPALTWTALSRLFDLAESGTHEALKVLDDDEVVVWLREPTSPQLAIGSATSDTLLSQEQRVQLRHRLQSMAAAGQYRTDVALARLKGVSQVASDAASAAAARLLARPEPDERSMSFGSQMVSDSYLASFLPTAEQLPCLEKMLTVADDRREAAANRQDALNAALHLVLEQDDSVKARVHVQSRRFVAGDQDGSFLDDEVSNPHPLSSISINFGSVSLRADGLKLAQATSITEEELMWVHDHAKVLLRSTDHREVVAAAQVLSRLNTKLDNGVDPMLLVSHPMRVVRQLACHLVAQRPSRFPLAVQTLAADPDWTIRLVLAERLNVTMVDETSSDNNSASPSDAVGEVLAQLRIDVRHSVRRAAAGLPT